MKNIIHVLLSIVLAWPSLSAQIAAIPQDLGPEDRICFALYTLHEQTLKLTAQFYPIQGSEPFAASLQILSDGEWHTVAEADIIYPGYTAPFRVTDWDDTQEYRYRVAHNNTAFYEGIIKANPIDKDEVVMATFSCNSVYPAHGGDLPRTDIIDNLKRLDPDILFFSGDQVYDHSQHYLHWLKFGRDFGDIIKDRPTICLPDDHDVGHPNLWGAGGKKATNRRGMSGGYYTPVSYVQEVERAQTSHLPDPYDPTPVDRGIGVYYTDLKWGGISFAILEDRKFKTGPAIMVDELPDIFTEGKPYEAVFDPNIDTKRFDVDGATLLGERQLSFLEEWTTDWSDADMKAVLSQTIFALVNNYTGEYGREIYADFDTNGWPQSGRNKALSTIRKSYSCMIAGDQHLGTVLQHGIEDWGDAGYSFATPAIANLWPRWWKPSKEGKNKKAGEPNYTGEYLDGFQNKMTVLAAANPEIEMKTDAPQLNTRAAGYGIVRFDKSNREITFECWARNVDMFAPDSKMYDGWPITISQMDNYQLKNGYQLPTLIIDTPDQVVTVRDHYTHEIISSVRISGQQYQPKTPRSGQYDISIGEDDKIIQISEKQATAKNREKVQIQLKMTHETNR